MGAKIVGTARIAEYSCDICSKKPVNDRDNLSEKMPDGWIKLAIYGTKIYKYICMDCVTAITARLIQHTDTPGDIFIKSRLAQLGYSYPHVINTNVCDYCQTIEMQHEMNKTEP